MVCGHATHAPRRGITPYQVAGSQRRYGTCWLASGDTIVTCARPMTTPGNPIHGDDMTATGLVHGSCGAELRAGDKFCLECAAPVLAAATPAKYKQVTVLFADVVHSMDIAAAVGAERLREIMADLADHCAAVVQHFGGTVDKFTGDGIMASSVRRWRWKITPSVPAWPPWVFRRRRSGSPWRSKTATVWTFGCGWA